MNRNGQFRDITLRSVVANWASVSSILGAQLDFYSLWASGRPLICIPDIGNFTTFPVIYNMCGLLVEEQCQKAKIGPFLSVIKFHFKFSIILQGTSYYNFIFSQ